MALIVANPGGLIIARFCSLVRRDHRLGQRKGVRRCGGMLFLMISKANRRSIRSAGHFFSMMMMGSALSLTGASTSSVRRRACPSVKLLAPGSNAALPARVALALGWAEVPA